MRLLPRSIPVVLWGPLGMLQSFRLLCCLDHISPHASHLLTRFLDILDVVGLYALCLPLQIQTSIPKCLCFTLKSFYFCSSSCPYTHYPLCPSYPHSPNILERQAKFFSDVCLLYQKAGHKQLQIFVMKSLFSDIFQISALKLAI